MTPAQAYRKVRSALAAGTIQRPSTCSRCNVADRKPITGIHSIQGHHYKGYDHPLDLEWLCPKCHRKETPLPEKMGAPTFGTRNGAARLNPDLVRQIVSAAGPSRTVAARFGIDKKTVLLIRRGETWSAVTGRKRLNKKAPAASPSQPTNASVREAGHG